MRRFAALLLFVTVSAAPAASAERPAYPPTRVDDVVENLHGTQVHDPYRWLEDGSSPEVQSWAKDQNAFARRQLDGLAGRDWLAQRAQEVSSAVASRVPKPAGSPRVFTRPAAPQRTPRPPWPVA